MLTVALDGAHGAWHYCEACPEVIAAPALLGFRKAAH